MLCLVVSNSFDLSGNGTLSHGFKSAAHGALDCAAAAETPLHEQERVGTVSGRRSSESDEK